MARDREYEWKRSIAATIRDLQIRVAELERANRVQNQGSATLCANQVTPPNCVERKGKKR
jgi:hypothetical protein